MSLSKLSDQPLSDQPTLNGTARAYVDYLDNLIDTPELYGYAADTLRGIQTSIRQTGKVTSGQRDAVHNIVEGGNRAAETKHRSSRRYEGWTRNG